MNTLDGSVLSVAQALTLERVVAGDPEVVAGAGQLQRPVRWVHVAEVADVGVMLNGGEMVLTTGVLLASSDELQTAYVDSLHHAKAAAIVLGLGRAFTEIPEAMRRAAERRGLPMIVLHRPLPFAELTEEIQSRLMSQKFAAASLSDSIRTALATLLTTEASLQQLLNEVAAHCGCPVVLSNLAHRVLATAGERPAADDVLRDWERIARRPWSSDADGWIRVGLNSRGVQWGHLVLCGYRGEASSGRLLAERAAEAIVLHRMLGGAVTRTWEEESAQSLVTDLVSGAIAARQLLPRVRAAGLPVNRRVFLPLAVCFVDPHRVEQLLHLTGLRALSGQLGDDVTAVLLSVEAGRSIEGIAERLAARLREEPGGAQAVIAVAAARAEWDDVPAGLREAQYVADTVAASSNVPELPSVVRQRDVHLRGLIRMLRDDPHLQAFAERELGGLLGQSDEDLLNVLRTYLTTGRNKTRTAQLHYISRPTLYRRLEEIELRLDVDLDDFEHAASVHIALLSRDAQSKCSRKTERYHGVDVTRCNTTG